LREHNHLLGAVSKALKHQMGLTGSREGPGRRTGSVDSE
jgi:hypothetical protein